MKSGYSTLEDVKAIERIPLAERDLPTSTYEALKRGAAIDPDACALHFFLRGTAYKRKVSFTFGEVMDRVPRRGLLRVLP